MNGELLVQRIKSLAISQGIKMGDLYENCGVTSGAVSQWKTGATNPTTPALQRIADYLHVSLSELIEGTDFSDIQRSGLRIRTAPPPVPNTRPGLRIRDNKKSPAPKEGEADRDELIRILSVLDPAEREQLLAHGRTLVIAHEAKGTGPKSP